MFNAAFRVPITLTSIAFDVLGAYTFVRMAENLGKHSRTCSITTIIGSNPLLSPIGHPICPPRPALVAGAVFGSLFSFCLTVLSCCVIGKSRTLPIHEYSDDGRVSGSAFTSCCGNRVHVSVNTTEYISGPGVHGTSSRYTTGTVYNSAHRIGVYWDSGPINGGCGFGTFSSRDYTTTTGHSNITTFNMG